MILIDSTYIYSGGGKNLLQYFLESLNPYSENIIILCDTRLYQSGFFSDYKNIKVIAKNEFSRFLFYFFNRNRVKKVFCFSSIPPSFVQRDTEVIIYFHNVYLLKKYRIISNFKFCLKKLFIRFFSKPNFTWYVQTDLVKIELISIFRFDPRQIHIMPFFRNLKSLSRNISPDVIKYVYIADGSIHKNHIFLLKNWEIFFRNIRKHQNVELNLTIANPSGALKHYIENSDYLYKNNIVNHGFLSGEKALELLSNSNYLLFVSNFESFGLPLIEACQLGCNVIAPNLDYVNEILIPSLQYAPNDSQDFLKKLNKSINISDTQPPILITENKMDRIINNLFYV